MSYLAGKHVLLIICGGIAAYKVFELIRQLRRAKCAVNCVMTENARHFVTPLSLQALSEARLYTDLFSLTDESEMGHIQLSRRTDLVVVAPASANLLAQMAAGMANDLASTVLLATDKPVLVAPAMNVRMWLHEATQANMAVLKQRGIHVVGPDKGDMACNEFGPGRMAEPPAILTAIEALLTPVSTRVAGQDGLAKSSTAGRQVASKYEASGYSRESVGQQLAGQHVLVTSGPTHEPIDPVRYISNRSSGRQGHAIAAAVAELGARVTLISGPVSVPDPVGVTVHRVDTAREMLAACEGALPADVAIFAAAVADWRVPIISSTKIKKNRESKSQIVELIPNPDILASVAAPGPKRPRLVIGFAAETNDLLDNARAKLRSKNADWIVANDVSSASGVMGGDENAVCIITAEGVDVWPRLPKDLVARLLAQRIAAALM